MGATTTRVCGESKRCITPCKCRRCTTGTKKRATSGCRNSSALTHKTSLTPSSWTLPTKSTRGVNERGRGLPAPGAPACICSHFKVKDCRTDAGRKWLLWECLGPLHMGRFFRTQLRIICWLWIHCWICFSPWMSDVLSSDPKPFPASQNIGNSKYRFHRSFVQAVLTSFCFFCLHRLHWCKACLTFNSYFRGSHVLWLWSFCLGMYRSESDN